MERKFRKILIWIKKVREILLVKNPIVYKVQKSNKNISDSLRKNPKPYLLKQKKLPAKKGVSKRQKFSKIKGFLEIISVLN